MAANNYEIMLVFSVANGEDQAKALLEKFTDMIKANGKVGKVDVWGKRRLAYLINDEPEGFYAVINYESEPEFQAELERVLHITDGVLRDLIIRKPCAPEAEAKDDEKAEEPAPQVEEPKAEEPENA